VSVQSRTEVIYSFIPLYQYPRTAPCQGQTYSIVACGRGRGLIRVASWERCCWSRPMKTHCLWESPIYDYEIMMDQCNKTKGNLHMQFTLTILTENYDGSM